MYALCLKNVASSIFADNHPNTFLKDLFPSPTFSKVSVKSTMSRLTIYTVSHNYCALAFSQPTVHHEPSGSVEHGHSIGQLRVRLHQPHVLAFVSHKISCMCLEIGVY